MVDGRGVLVTRLTALVQSALCAGLMRAAYDRGDGPEARRIAAWSRAYGRTAGLNVPMPRSRAFDEVATDEEVGS